MQNIEEEAVLTIVGTSGIPVVESRRAGRQGMSYMEYAYSVGYEKAPAYVQRIGRCGRGTA